jgi:hypothetical protein
MQFNLVNKENTDPLILWKQLVSKLNTYDNIVSCKLFTDGKKVGIKVQFKNSTKEYTYIGKNAIVGLLKPEDKSFWQQLPF